MPGANTQRGSGHGHISNLSTFKCEDTKRAVRFRSAQGADAGWPALENKSRVNLRLVDYPPHGYIGCVLRLLLSGRLRGRHRDDRDDRDDSIRHDDARYSPNDDAPNDDDSSCCYCSSANDGDGDALPA